MDKYFSLTMDGKVNNVDETDLYSHDGEFVITEKSMKEFLGNLENFMKTKTDDYCAIMWDCEVIELKANNFDDAEDLVVNTGLNDWMIADSEIVQIFIDNIKKVLL